MISGTALHTYRSVNWDDRPAGHSLDILVLHYTGMPTAEDALSRLCDPAAQVSAHYLIDEDGIVFSLVPEEKRAWHAGVSCWRRSTGINARSIGIEIVNPGHEFGYRPFPEVQMAAVVDLSRDILDRHSIPPRNVVGHADVAPRRKTDPGELFDWRLLAEAGIGLWPVTQELCDVDDAKVATMLTEYGYEIVDVSRTVAAFQRHFRPERVDGEADAETAGRLKALLALIRAETETSASIDAVSQGS